MLSRRRARDAVQAGYEAPGLNDIAGEAFQFSPAEYELFKKLRPDLFDRDASPDERRRRWVAFADTSEGRALRVR